MSAHLCGAIFPVPEPIPLPPSPLPDAPKRCADCRALLPRSAYYVTDRDDAAGRDALCRPCRDESNRRERIAKRTAVAW